MEIRRILHMRIQHLIKILCYFEFYNIIYSEHVVYYFVSNSFVLALENVSVIDFIETYLYCNLGHKVYGHSSKVRPLQPPRRFCRHLGQQCRLHAMSC